jgi:predicted thioesterase
MNELKPGLVHETEYRVEEKHLASSWGSGLAQVLATPVLVAFCEECSRLLVEPLLPAGQQTVGTSINLKHLAATPLGMGVRIRAELVGVAGSRLTFQVEAWDDVELIAEGEHERFVIDAGRFQSRLEKKLSGAL